MCCSLRPGSRRAKRSGMAWIESHQSLGHHRKTLQVAATLKVDRHKLIGHLQVLWWWGLDNADPSGKLGQVGVSEIGEAAEWPGKDAGRFVQALLDAHFLERDQDGFSLHDWWDYAGKLNAARAKNRERMQVARAAHVGRMSGARAPATVPNQPDQPPPMGPPPNGASHVCCNLAGVTKGERHSRTCPASAQAAGSPT